VFYPNYVGNKFFFRNVRKFRSLHSVVPQDYVNIHRRRPDDLKSYTMLGQLYSFIRHSPLRTAWCRDFTEYAR